MVSLKKCQAAVVSACGLFQAGCQTLLAANSLPLAWHCKDVSVAQSYLNARPTDVLIMSLHIHQQVDLLPLLRFIHQVRLTQPDVKLMIVVDVPIPYLVTQLRHLGVSYILSMEQPLVMWQRHLRQIMLTENGQVGTTFPGCREETLSAAERRVVHLLLKGYSVTEIALLMMRSVKTISTQKVAAMHKLGIRHWAQMVAVQSVFIDSWQPPMRDITCWGAYQERPRHIAEFTNLPFENRKYAL